MGIIKNIFKPVVKDAEHMVYQTKALLKQDKISKGEKVLAPKHPTDEAHFKEAQKDDKIREEVNKRRDDLIEKVNKITIKSFDPPERPKSSRPLPTRDTEYEHINSPGNEYGYYEPPLEKMQPGKLTLREAMDLLYAKTEIDLEGDKVDNAKSVLQAHPATSRISAEDIEDLYKYYRPFIRKDIQRIAIKGDLDTISDYMNNRGAFSSNFLNAEMDRPKRALKHFGQTMEARYSTLDSKTKQEVVSEIVKRRIEERKRLEDHLQTFADEVDPKKKENEKK